MADPTAQPWPDLRGEDRWLTEAMENRLRASTQTPEDLTARARELREQADATDIKGMRDACLALAARYEEAAAARPTAR
jgi:hypothetical protein